MTVKATELIIFAIMFGTVTVMGFVASRWKPGTTLEHLDEWGLGGRKFGSWVCWFLIGGDVYTAYTFVAVPALLFSAGAAGFFALPYTIVVYPIVFMPLLRIWSVCRVHGYVTQADFVRGRYGSPTLALLVAITGIAATMPYIALQLVGLEAVLRTMGLNQAGWVGHLPLFLAFVILALYTYQSGLRAPALIAFVKDILIYLVVVVAVLYLPIKLGGWDSIFGAADAKFQQTQSSADGLLLNSGNQLQYATLALGSALALFLYPHTVTGVLAARSRHVIKLNMSALPMYSLLLGLMALLGYCAIAAGVRPLQNAATGGSDSSTIVPVLFDQQFPDWFAGLAFAAIGIGALVPAAIMSIAASNLWTRNIYKEYLRRDATPEDEARQAKMASLLVKFGAVVFIVVINPQYAIDLQLIGGVIILQILPAVGFSLYTRWFHRHALISGWIVGMLYGLWMLYQVPNPGTGRQHFGGSAYPLKDVSLLGLWSPFEGSNKSIYVGFAALLVNIVVAALVTVILHQIKVFNGTDATDPADYYAEEGDETVEPVYERVGH
ncbi:MAG TPA: sodium:solute symporter [Pseudonocardiaceae bacterium]|jgi:SSS family solute:Na+ symporter